MRDLETLTHLWLDSYRGARNVALTTIGESVNHLARCLEVLAIFGDDIGQTNINAYAFGVVGYHTPNIDRIAKEGMMLNARIQKGLREPRRKIKGQIGIKNFP
jgi:hypothetical protein